MMEKSEDNILYDLLIHVEWPLEPIFIGDNLISQGGSVFYRAFSQAPSNVLSLVTYATKYIIGNGLSTNLSRIFNSGSEWQLSVGAQGAVIAVLQNNCLEIRAKKDNYGTIVGKNINLYSDPFPSWRKVCWSSECSMIALAYSNGTVEIFNTVGASLFMIYPPRFQEGKIQVDTSDSLAALFFSESRTSQIKWAAELIMVDFHGVVRGYYVSPTEGYQESHSFSLHKLYPSGISAAVNVGSLLVVCGSCQYINDSMLKNNGMGHGLSIWRMTNEYPFYKQVPTFDDDEYSLPKQGLFSQIPFLKSVAPYDSIFRLCVSPLGRQIVAIHASGSISLWDIPSLRKKKYWSLENQSSCHHQTSFIPSIAIIEDLHPLISEVRWWSEDALIITRFSGAVTVCSTKSLVNLLGESPEFFEGVPQISDAFDRSFLGLEMEKKIVSSQSRMMDLSGEETKDHSLLKQEDEEDLTPLQRSKFVFNKVMFWITDAERFRPLSKRTKIITQTGRLLCLKSTSPAELFGRKIENEEYGEALALAQRYELDCDLVHQQQWRKTPVTITTIQDYLVKIRKRSWVLQECLNRVPDDIDAARELLLYGLRGTELDTLVAIENEENIDEFILSDLALEYEEEDDFDINHEENEIRAEEWAVKDLKRRTELLSRIDFMNLSEEQVAVIKARQKLLVYYDRLGSYEDLLGGPVFAGERYDSKFYNKFRNQSDTEAAIEFAKDYNWKGVDVMLVNHRKSTWHHRLAIISCFPGTMGPYEYRTLLPECDLSGDVFEELTSDQMGGEEGLDLRDEDWCEDSICRKAAGLEEDTTAIDALYESNEYLRQFRDVEITAEILSQWYKYCAQKIEQTSHFVDVALDLLKLGRERNIPNLLELHNDFDTLELLVYEVGLTEISLKQLQNMDDLAKLKLLMSTTTVDTFVQHIRRWGLPFLSQCDKKDFGNGIYLLKEYLVCISKYDLSFALKTVQHSHRDQPDPIVQRTEDLIQLVIDCIYSCEKESQLPRAFAMLECLPVKTNKSYSKEIITLYEEIDKLDDHLGVAELLSYHGILVSPAVLQETETDETKIHLLLTRLARTSTRGESKLTQDSWQKLLNDMLELRQRIFRSVEPQTCFEIVTEALLASGVRNYIDFASELLVTSVDSSIIENPYLQKLPYPISVSLVIKSATEYFNASENYFDANMELARHCLNIIEQGNEHILRELDLIESLEILPDIGIHKLPLQVRLCTDRLELIKEALNDQPGNHIYGTRILRLADLLRVCDDNEERRKGEIYSLLAEAAYQVNDLISACNWCSKIIGIGCRKGWAICSLLGRCDRITDYNQRIKLLNFALIHATSDHLEDVLLVRNQVELLVLYEKVSRRMDCCDSIDSEEGFVDARADSDDQESDDDDEWSETQTEAAERSSDRLLSLPLNFTKTILSATAATTTSFVSNVANKKLWKNATSFLRPLQGLTLTLGEDYPSTDDSNLGFEKQGCHAFFSGLYDDCHLSKLGVTYKSYASPTIYNSALDISWSLLRVALLEETLSLGKYVQLNRNVLDEVTKAFLVEDWSLGLALLDLQSPEHAEELLLSLPRTEISLLTSLFYHGLKIYMLIHPFEGAGIAPAFLHPPMDLINWASSFAQNGIVPLSKEQKARFHIDKFILMESVVAEFLQAQTLQKLGAGIDTERFLTDNEYKKDSVLGLAMFTERDVFELAVKLAAKYDVSKWQVYMTHLQFLFDSDLETKCLGKEINKRNLLPILKENPDDFATAMYKDVLFTVSGTDYDRLRYFYGLILQITDDPTVKMKYSTHIECVSQIQSVAHGLDYKALLSQNRDGEDHLKPFVTMNNISDIANVTKSLEKYEDGVIKCSTVYCVWARKQFFENRPKTSLQWIQRYKDTECFFKEMIATDVGSLIKSVVFSGESSVIPIDAREEIMKRSVTYCNTKLKEEVKNKSSTTKTWTDLYISLDTLSSHLSLLNSETFKNLARSKDHKLQEYAKQFELSGGDEILLSNLSHQILRDFSSLETLRSILTVYPDDLLAEDIFMQVFNNVLREIKDIKGIELSSKIEGILDHLLKELSVYSEDGGELLQEEDILEELREFSRDSEYSSSSRIRVLQIAQKYLPLTEEDSHHLQSMQTGGIVSAAFNSPGQKETSSQHDIIPPDQVETEEGRKILFESLLKRMDTVKKAQSIIELLKIWPSFDQQLYENLASNPWTKVFFKVFGLSKATGVEEYLTLIQKSSFDAIRKGQMPEECVQIVVDNILALGSSHHLQLAAKIAFQSSSPASQATVLEVYKTIEKIPADAYDTELLDSIIENKIVAKTVPTTLYAPLINYLNESKDVTKREKVIEQLESSNHWMEAASLAMLGSSFPRSLKIASNAFKIFGRKS